MGSFCSRVADIALSVQTFCYLHGMLGTHSWEGTENKNHIHIPVIMVCCLWMYTLPKYFNKLWFVLSIRLTLILSNISLLASSFLKLTLCPKWCIICFVGEAKILALKQCENLNFCTYLKQHWPLGAFLLYSEPVVSASPSLFYLQIPPRKEHFHSKTSDIW